MRLNMLYYVKQILTFFSKAAGKFNIMQFERLSIKYSKKMNFRLKRDIAAIRNNCVIKAVQQRNDYNSNEGFS